MRKDLNKEFLEIEGNSSDTDNREDFEPFLSTPLSQKAPESPPYPSFHRIEQPSDHDPIPVQDLYPFTNSPIENEPSYISDEPSSTSSEPSPIKPPPKKSITPNTNGRNLYSTPPCSKIGNSKQQSLKTPPIFSPNIQSSQTSRAMSSLSGKKDLFFNSW